MGTTIAAISTGQAPGGIGVIRVSGPEAFRVCDKIFRSKFSKRITEMSGYTAALGGIYQHGDVKIDDCVALVFRGPRSYTGEDVVELSCHGGLYVTRQVLAEVLRNGAVPAEPGEFTRRAFMNGKLDLAQAESVMEIISAGWRHAIMAALSAESGVLSRNIENICSKLEDLAAHLAAWADFPDEDVDVVDIDKTQECLLICSGELAKLLDGFERGKIFREGIKTVLVGRPNVGKSTFMNLIVGHERSIVTPYAGTTRDVVEEQVSLAGVPLLLADTAGLRETNDPIERIGVESTKKKLKSAELVIVVFDYSENLSEEDIKLIELVRGIPAIAVINKCDLKCELNIDYIKDNFKYCVTASAVKNEGLDELEHAFSELIGIENFDTGQAELFTERQRFAALAAKDALEQGIGVLDMGLTLDALTVCIEDALAALYRLTGRRVSDEIVDQVFERFCVGK